MYFISVCVTICVLRTVATGARAEDTVNYGTNFMPSCDNKIFCESELLHDVALSLVDAEMNSTFLRKKMLFPELVILEKYGILKESNGGKPLPLAELIHFIEENFEDVQELEEWVPPDFKQRTALMDRVVDMSYRQFLEKLHQIWKILFRKVNPDVAMNGDRYSLIYVPNGFCIAGGHFNELYYWDTYWIINGLLLSDMSETVKGILENFLHLVRIIGFIPNGTRVFYLNRSQPPLLIRMVESYLQKTDDFFFVRLNLPLLTQEFEWWRTNREVKFVKDDKTYVMFRYNVQSRGPRPESYLNDYTIGHRFESAVKQDRWYSDIKSAAESGWDFSTRWLISDEGCNNGSLEDIKTSSVVPVDLNAILQKNAALLSEWWYRSGDLQMGKYYRGVAEQLLREIDEVFWRDDAGSWFDYDLINQNHRQHFYPSNFAPLWTGSYSQNADYVANKVINYLKRERILCRDGTPHYMGVPTSLFPSGQQWDFPNAWAPVQMFLIQGLDQTNSSEAQSIALKLAQNWVHTNYLGYLNTGQMFEKYDAVKEGVIGGGGEYEPQTGFGWTNGAVIQLLDRYSDLLRSGSSQKC